ncbi:MAG: type II toxin-antitoxin system RelB/DinJ family antitoxin [Oscillospiraceae bacterium]|jgi:DNA-damage-inducible protein J|nr:type II toxin-antitoxin system RelB/DinJ family antitoxin [Oscillospiraceae bacterium]
MANVNIRIDDNLKRDTEGILSELGLSLSAATTMFYKQVVRYGGIPLDLRVERPNQETLEAIAEVQKMKKNPSLGKAYTDVDKMMKELLS